MNCTCEIPGIVFDAMCPVHGLGPRDDTPPPASLTGVMTTPPTENLDPEPEAL